MPPSNLARKLKPARKAWKSFTNKLKSKLHSFNVPTSIKSATHRLLEFCSHHLFTPLKRRFLSKYSSSSSTRPRGYNYNSPYSHLYHYQHYQSQLYKNNRKAIYIDQLYAEEQQQQQSSSVSMQAAAKRVEPKAESSRRNNEQGEEMNSGIDSIEDAWKAIVAKSPHLRGVDERADEFIYRFREDRKLEKERSDLDFKEMLARSA